MNFVKSLLLLLVFGFLAFAQSAFSQATLSVQGVLKNSDGSAVDNGKYDLGFKLYNSATGGTAIWSETQSNIQVTGGIYSVLLGEATPLTAAFNETYYVGVSVDGGAELVPRAKLTSSPYALALLGVTNVFPSSGAIGAGTVSPVAGYQLHVKNGSGTGKMLVEGSSAGQIDFKKGNAVGSIGFGTANDNFVVNPGANNTTLQHNGSTKLTVNTNGVDVSGTLSAGTLTATNFSPASMAITSKLAVGQASVDASKTLKVAGNTEITGFLDVTGNAGNTSGSGGYLASFGAGTSSFTAIAMSIRATSSVLAEGFRASSDSRIKKDFRLSDKNTDLSTLQNLRVTDYRHIDAVSKGTAFKKGFIAQEVEQVFPEAVSQSEDFIPDVYALSAQTKLAAGKLTITLDKNHELAVGDEVKLMLADGERQFLVVALPSENAFSIDWADAAAPDKVFVYGKKVKDFHTVDYDRIFTLNVSATQELARQVEELKKENAMLKTEAKASAEKFEARLRALEKSMMNEK